MTPNNRDLEVAAGVCTRRADEPFAASCIAAYRIAVERDARADERERLMGEVLELLLEHCSSPLTPGAFMDALRASKPEGRST